jgi:hypothetical protein
MLSYKITTGTVSYYNVQNDSVVSICHSYLDEYPGTNVTGRRLDIIHTEYSNIIVLHVFNMAFDLIIMTSI